MSDLLTKSEAHAVAELIDLTLIDTIRQDTDIDSLLWLRRLVHAFEKLCKYSGYNSGYADEEAEDSGCHDGVCEIDFTVCEIDFTKIGGDGESA